jgi:hypothetical protein
MVPGVDGYRSRWLQESMVAGSDGCRKRWLQEAMVTGMVLMAYGETGRDQN